VSEETTSNNRSWIIQWVIGIALTGIAVFILSRVIRWEELILAFSSISLPTLLTIFVIYLVALFARAWCWQTLLQRKVSLGRAFLVLNEGYFLNNILPLRLGEIGMAFLMGRRTGAGTLSVFSTIVMERAFDMAYAAGLLLIALPYVLKMDWARPLALIVLALIILGIFSLYLAARHRERLEKVLIRWGDKSKIIQRWVLPSIHNILDGFSVLTRFDLFLMALGALGISWVLAVLRDYIVLHALVPTAPLWWAVLSISASNLGGALPSMAASLGTFEGAATGALTLAGASPEVGLAYALVIHIVHLVFSSIVGAIGISQEGKSLGSLISELRRGSKAGQNPADEPGKL
jgi:glycosyltransferase 2 family protein